MIGIWLLTYFVLKANLVTTISSQGISCQFIPFQRQPKFIAWQDTKTCYIRRYSPLKEYGGWGYRNYAKNSAYTTSGVECIQMVLKSGEFILISTTKGAQARAIINSIHEVSDQNSFISVSLPSRNKVMTCNLDYLINKRPHFSYISSITFRPTFRDDNGFCPVTRRSSTSI